jgi:methylornithine synthase
MGEDPRYHKDGLSKLAALVKDVKVETGLPVMVSPGIARREAIRALVDAGADWYALYQETHNQQLFAALRPNQSYDERIEAKQYARSLGMFIEEGILTGVGETIEDLAHSIVEMKLIGAQQIRVMSFCPHQGTPMEDVPSPDRAMELKVIAVMRLLSPKALIPASLDVDGLEGLAARVNAGANVITSIIPPASGLSGVATTGSGIEETGRTVAEASDILHSMNLRAATSGEYASFIATLRN